MKKDSKSPKCMHCTKPISKRRIKEHQAKCTAANMALPDGYRAEIVEGKLAYFCSCGYRGKRYVVLQHAVKCQQKKRAAPSTNSSVSELQAFQQTGQFAPLPDSELAPIVLEPIQTASKTIEEIEFEQDSNCKNFDYRIHPRFAQFKQPKEDAPITNLENRFKIFTISLLLRFTGYFNRGKKEWEKGRCQNINTERFLTQLNSHSSIFKGAFRTLANVQADLKDVAAVD